MYAAKRYAYTPPVYRVRNLLAAFDHNKHADRPKAVKKDRSVRLHRIWNKKSGRWSVYEEKEKKTFQYIPELLTSALKLRLNDNTGMKKKKTPGTFRNI
ncbi:hypothetical protein DPMN_034177 [Dreissena polymorpha]|uniref:Uncharacterized protein n=1 Tax=Dreissena polymorpha TaxID=45954 RepID=A0A9D4M6B4_DREPO|nr:hypothetical protein DPMN_034177 [Dreissena polymorpha]